MTRPIRYFLVILLTGIVFVLGNSSCSKGDRSMCDRDRTYKKSSNLRNKANYSSRYGTKAKPVKKDYVIKNKKTGKKY